MTEAHNPNMVANVGALDAISHYYESTVHSLPNRGLRWEKTDLLISVLISLFLIED